MYTHETETLRRILRLLKADLPDKLVAAYAIGSKVRKDHGEWSDFDLLVIVKDKSPNLEATIVSIIVDEEWKSGLSITPLIKDLKAFELEKRFHTPFYQNVEKEGVLL